MTKVIGSYEEGGARKVLIFKIITLRKNLDNTIQCCLEYPNRVSCPKGVK